MGIRMVCLHYRTGVLCRSGCAYTQGLCGLDVSISLSVCGVSVFCRRGCAYILQGCSRGGAGCLHPAGMGEGCEWGCAQGSTAAAGWLQISFCDVRKEGTILSPDWLEIWYQK